MEFDDYLHTPDALRQTESAQGTLLHVGDVLDGLRVLAFLGRGAAGEVWRVRDLRQNRDYALKIFAPPVNAPEQARRRFLTEAHALDEFRHPNLMRRYRFKEDGEHPYFTMDVLHPLPEHLPEYKILRLVDDILAGLDALHAKGLVHRDVKPSNILLDAAGRAVLTDLGACHIADANLAKRLDDTAAPHPTFLHGSPFVGTPRYAAPEQFAGEDATPATDIHALGVVIGELFGGRMPLSWRWLLYRMTASSGGVRLQTVRAVRRQLALVRLFPWCVRMLAIVAVLVAAGLTWHLAQPTWIELPDSFLETQRNPYRWVMTLEGGHYSRPNLCPNPLLTSPLKVKKGAPQNTRVPIFIQGRGTLKCPMINNCELHLSPGVTLITSGRSQPDGVLVVDPVPPPDVEWGDIGYPAYIVEPGAKLVFTENKAYPQALIRRP